MATLTKILMSVGSLDIGGNEIFAMNVFRNINRKKFSIDFIIFDDENMVFYDEIISNGSKVWKCTSTRKNKYLALLDQMMQVRTVLKNNHYDVIHCNSCSAMGILHSAIPAYFSKNIKIVTHAHNVGESTNTICNNIGRGISRLLISHMADFGFACSENAGNSKYTNIFMKTNNYKVINNAVNIYKYLFDLRTREEIREEMCIEEKEFIIGTIGRLEYQKNPLYLIDIFDAFLKKTKKKSKLLIIGQGPLENEIKKKIHNLGIGNNVILAGQKKDANKYYNAMDCFVLPSLFEGFPFVLVEAQINSLRCFISDTITNDVNISGTIDFLPLGDVNAWVDRLDEFDGARISKNDIKKVVSLYDINEEMKIIEQVYMTVI